MLCIFFSNVEFQEVGNFATWSMFNLGCRIWFAGFDLDISQWVDSNPLICSFHFPEVASASVYGKHTQPGQRTNKQTCRWSRWFFCWYNMTKHTQIYIYIYIFPARPILSQNLQIFAVCCCFFRCLNVFFCVYFVFSKNCVESFKKKRLNMKSWIEKEELDWRKKRLFEREEFY